MAMKLPPCSDHGNTFPDRPRKAGERSDGFQIDCGRLAVLSLFELVGDLLILVEIAESGAFHRRDVHEHVLGLVVRLNEAETLAGIEPFHGAGRHGYSRCMKSPRAGVRGASNCRWENDAPRKGCRGLTQVEFDAVSMVAAARNSKERGESGSRAPGSPRRATLSPCPNRRAASSTWTWTRSMRRWSSATTLSCAAGRSRSAARRSRAAWWPPRATRRALSACARQCRWPARFVCALRSSSCARILRGTARSP